MSTLLVRTNTDALGYQLVDIVGCGTGQQISQLGCNSHTICTNTAEERGVAD